MKKNIIGECPICHHDLVATKLTCQECKTEILGEFELSKFDKLTSEQLTFVLVFIKNQGNIKSIEQDLGISYPTVKKNLDEVIKALGFEVVKKNDRQIILGKLQRGEISFDEAEKLLMEV